jgi:hypothetical protein
MYDMYAPPHAVLECKSKQVAFIFIYFIPECIFDKHVKLFQVLVLESVITVRKFEVG